MLLSLFVLVLLVALGLVLALAMDGVIPVPLHRIADFPFRNMPSTNGLLFGLALAACLALLGWLMGPRPRRADISRADTCRSNGSAPGAADSGRDGRS